MFLKLVEKTRTIRRFDRSKLITDTDLMSFLECARKSASAGNLQRIRFVTVSGSEAEKAFSNVSLGGLLPPDKKPTQSVAPTAYIVLCSKEENPDANLLIDVGITAQTIALSAAEKGVGACMIRNFSKEYFSSLMSEEFPFPILVIALGYPSEIARTVDVSTNDSLKYYKNESGENIVPKLTLSELVIKKYN